MRVEHGRTVLDCRLKVKVELGRQEGRVDAEPPGLTPEGAVTAVVPHEVADQRILDRKDRIAAEVFVGPIENVRRHRLVALS